MKESGEKAPTGDEVERGVELEKEQFARQKRLEVRVGRWAPEVDLIHLRAGGVEVKPVLISYADEYSHLAIEGQFTGGRAPLSVKRRTWQ